MLTIFVSMQELLSYAVKISVLILKAKQKFDYRENIKAAAGH